MDKGSRKFEYKGENKLRLIVREVIQDYISNNPDVTYEQLKDEVFARKKISKFTSFSYEIVLNKADYEKEGENKKTKYMENKTLPLKNGDEIYVCGEWGANKSNVSFIYFRKFVEEELGCEIEETIPNSNTIEENMDNAEKHKLLAEFLQEWPIARLQQMTLDEYSNLNKSDSFCYWLELKTQELGSIWGR